MGPQAVYKAILLAVMLNAVVVNGRSLEQPRYATAYACEGSTLSIECREGELIHLIRANYGRFSITICNEHGNTEWSVNCMSPKSLRVLHNKCTQQQNCSILASTSTFGDPCPGTLKYLEAHYQCMPATTTTTTNRPSPPWLVTSRPGSWSTPKAPTSKGGAPEGAASSTPMPTPAHPQPSAAAARPRTPGDDPPSSLLPLPDGGEGEEGVVVVVDEGPKPGTDELPVSSVTALSIPGTPASPPVSSTPVGKTTGRPTSVLSVRVLETRNVGVEEFPSPAAWDQWNASRDWVQLPRAALLENGEGGLVRLVFIAFDRLEEVLRPQPVSPSWRDGMNVMRKATRVLNSKVISASLGKGRHIQLSSPVRISLRHIRTENVSDPACVFWDYTTSSWSEEGCRVESTNISHTLCQCDHLTNFAVLMDIHSTLLNPPHQTALQIITYVGCIISSVCLVLAIITFQLFRGLKSDRTTIHKNLCVCLLVAEVLFLAGIGQTDKPVVCGIVAGLLHFFFLCAFAWMFLEGFQLYVMLIEVFETEKSRMRWYYIFAYGAPLIIVIVSCVVDPLSYGTQRYCWLRADNFFIFSFVGPVIAVILANLVFLSMAIYKMCRHANASVSIKSKEHSRLASASGKEENVLQKKLQSHLAWLRGAIVLVFLLGLTWTFGLLYLNEESIIMAYIFTVLNSLQGLFIFVFHCVQNEKVRKEYRKFVRRNSWLPKCLQCSKNSSSKERRSSFYAGSNGNPSAPNSHSTDSSALSPHGTSYFLQRGWSTRSSSRPKASVGPSVARCSHLAPCPTAASNPSDLEAEVCASSAAKTNTGISLPYASGHSHPHIPKSATCGLLHNPLLWKNISFKSYSRDSGHGGSEQEDLPRSHNLAMQNSLNNVRSLNNSKDSRRLPYMPPDYHQGITNDLSVTHCPSIDVEHSSGIHCAPRAVMSTTEEPHARRPDAAALPQYSARQGHLLPALHQGARGSKKSSNGLHRSMSPWNHTYTEIREGHQLSHPLVKFHAHTLGLPEDDPVYEEIERNDAQVSDVSDEDMKRQSDTSRQSSRSYGDHRPLIPYSPASDRNFQNCIEDALKKKLRELHHLESSVRGAHSDIGEGGPESPMGGHVEVATSESDFPVVVPGGCDPPSAPESLSFAGENARTVAVLDGETVVCHLRPENELYACDPFNSRTIELSPYSEC
ncbi:adhesion G protein-coupled receptor L2-like isoform X5 [Ischnura elegans]|uniref:adhesion G protein-coupled receptor L2-like isoform X5 n=1 Tax=Ischnura elegans TaxID=197161 RepID=UPI001ED88C33|nr:adhesion G protein-coupled receptor L2-like isoform X5 [Ischnura elegans]